LQQDRKVKFLNFVRGCLQHFCSSGTWRRHVVSKHSNAAPRTGRPKYKINRTYE